ncbi:unnamed protein product [marine sediment metagenome]|uniref:Uncharacterized protein n=1 Tax=marine sediment metagenome TaxID=412755 RepID=X1H3R3_9ZZZZ
MTNFGLEDLEFVYDYFDFEKNRMYPPNHTGETMIAINDSHLRAIARANYFVQSGITNNMTPKMRESIERDIVRLDEVHKFCRQQISEPGLPMSPIHEAVAKVGEAFGNTDTKTDN